MAFSQGSSPITAAGPRLILTGLPFLSFESTGKCIYSVVDITIADQFPVVKSNLFRDGPFNGRFTCDLCFHVIPAKLVLDLIGEQESRGENGGFPPARE